jgi:hypothetical protein
MSDIVKTIPLANQTRQVKEHAAGAAVIDGTTLALPPFRHGVVGGAG